MEAAGLLGSGLVVRLLDGWSRRWGCFEEHTRRCWWSFECESAGIAVGGEQCGIAAV